MRMRRSRTRLVILARLTWRSRLLILGGGLAAYGVLSAVYSLPWWVDIVPALIGVSIAWNEILIAKSERRAMYFLKRVDDDYSDVLPGLVHRGRPISSGSGQGVLLFAESRAVRSGGVDAKVSRTGYRAKPALRRWSLEFLSREHRGSTFFNGDVVGIEAWSTDLGTVTLRRCGYFDFISTNLLGQYDVREGEDRDEHGDERQVLSGRRLFLDRFGELRSFDQSWLANTVGVSTLAFSADGKLLIVQQTPKNIGSPGLRAPSGSGALEKVDLPIAAGPVSLESVVGRGATREMMEECHVDPMEISGTSVISFGRWLTRGAMPEFSAVTLLETDGSDIASRPVRSTEKDFVQCVRAIRLAPMSEWNADNPESLLPAKERVALSFPLLLALSGLVDAIHDPAWPEGAELRQRLQR